MTNTATEAAMLELGRAIDGYLSGPGVDVQRLLKPDGHRAAWRVALGERDCIVTCEDNAEDYGVPTVTVVLNLFPLDDVEGEDFAKYLEISGQLVGASLGLGEDAEGRPTLAVCRRVRAKGFDPENLPEEIDDMVTQVSLLWTEESAEIQEAATEESSGITMEDVDRWLERAKTLKELVEFAAEVFAE